MLKKQEVVDLLNSMIDDTNKDKIENYKEKVANIDERDWITFLENIGVKTLQDAQRFIANDMKTRNDKFIELNELISYGITADTINLHVVPEDVRYLLNQKGLEKAEYLLIDALEKIQVMLQEDKKLENIEKVYAVSGIIRKPISTLFEKLGFDTKIMKTELAKKDEELQKFYERFKDKKYIGRANLLKEKLLSEEWNRHKEQRKEQLLAKVKGIVTEEASSKGKNVDDEKTKESEFMKDLEQVYSYETVAVNTEKREETVKQINANETTRETNIIV